MSHDQPVPLFNKIEEDMAQQLKERFAGKQQPLQTAVASKAALQEQLDKQVRGQGIGQRSLYGRNKNTSLKLVVMLLMAFIHS